jgi:hypothetical protein
VTYRELLLTGATTGLVSRLVVEAAAGERLLGSSPEGPPREAVGAEARRFRVARHLESGEDLRVWLSSRGLTLDEFDRYLSRVVARQNAGSSERHADLHAERNGERNAERNGERNADLHAERNADLPDLEVEPGELTSKLLFGELAFSGAWRAFADTAVRLFAAELLSRQGSPGSPTRRLPEPGQGLPAEDRFGPPPAEVLKILRPFGAFDPQWCAQHLEVLRSRARLLDDIERQVRGSEGVTARLEDYRLEWALFRFDELSLGSRAAALEALSCSSADGIPADEIARRAGTELIPRRARREELPAGQAALLDGAAQDEAVGPVERERGFSVLWLRDRSRPDGADPEVAERAVEELLSETLERAATGAVREFGQL